MRTLDDVYAERVAERRSESVVNLPLMQAQHDRASEVALLAADNYVAGLITLLELQAAIARASVPDATSGLIDRQTGLRYK